MTTTDDIVRKKLMPEDHNFLPEWSSNNAQVLTDLADHFCRRFPGDVEISLALKMRSKGDGTYAFTVGDITASREAIRKAFAEHEEKK
jgi:hypothetical protein